ncbi:MAG: DUF1819 family protein [Candidatus Dadabacteria bacterium]|nr:MAG: DUF1819 family protein [Candidatus Dadabacteria bacterium]
MSKVGGEHRKPKDSIVRTYDLKLHNGGLLWHELKVIAGLMIKGLSKKDLRARVLEQNLLNRNTKKTASNLFTYLYGRLSSTAPRMVDLIAVSDSISSKQAALVASVSSSRVLREFFRDVVSEKLESMNPVLRSTCWPSFWASCVSKDPQLEKARAKTVDEIRQKSISFLVDLNILDPAGDNTLRHLKFTPQVCNVLKDDCDIEVIQSLRTFL